MALNDIQLRTEKSTSVAFYIKRTIFLTCALSADFNDIFLRSYWQVNLDFNSCFDIV